MARSSLCSCPLLTVMQNVSHELETDAAMVSERISSVSKTPTLQLVVRVVTQLSTKVVHLRRSELENRDTKLGLVHIRSDTVILPGHGREACFHVIKHRHKS